MIRMFLSFGRDFTRNSVFSNRLKDFKQLDLHNGLVNPALCQRMVRDECKVVIIAEFLSSFVD